MKKDQLNRVKDTINSTIYKVTDLLGYKSEIFKIIEAHYCYRAYVNHWGKLFTKNDLHPELNVNYSGVLAEMFCMSDVEKDILNILDRNTPTYDTLETSCEIVFKELSQYLRKQQLSGKITLTHNVLKTLIRQAVAVEMVQERIACNLFKSRYTGRSGYSFERSYESKSYQLEAICSVVIEALGWSSEWEQNDDLWHCFISMRDIDPFDSPDLDKEIDEYIIFILQLITTLKPYQQETKQELKVA